MAAVVPCQDGCQKCYEMQRLYLKTLDDKKEGLVRLQEEQEKTKKLRRKVEKLVAKLSERGKVDAGDKKSAQVMYSGNKWRQMDCECHETEKCRQLQREADQAKYKLSEAESRIVALESEVMRLASSITEMHRNPEGPSAMGNPEHTDIVKQQLEVYKEDFTKERKDRERAQNEKEHLQLQLESAHEVISTLTQELDLYKEEIKRNQEEKKLLLSRRHSAPVPIPAEEPQLQIVYPIVNSSQQRQWQWQQERRRRQGILTRGPMPAPPSAFFGGEMEVDQWKSTD